ncbi:hypothetical protein PLESTB_001797300 [Pleodorina starrii]|uniref:Uncharacterized protein n=1 Tax=Pleodorina starrii TaxID=330485 RepID=A0A9W6C006_9CHLO|nr:hypothetical protein PLESTM_001161700 [Pleodorina starrii]GLC61736.1 hypothetical protein PLESTB_001797300 [Pleodorina starrii]GLC69216.1 hypothetical protein PLESTF_000803000 [Pleodorina starrii]
MMIPNSCLEVYSWSGDASQLEQEREFHYVNPPRIIAPAADIIRSPAPSRKRYYVLEPLGVWVKRGRFGSSTSVGPLDDEAAPSPPAPADAPYASAAPAAPVACATAASTATAAPSPGSRISEADFQAAACHQPSPQRSSSGLVPATPAAAISSEPPLSPAAGTCTHAHPAVYAPSPVFADAPPPPQPMPAAIHRRPSLPLQSPALHPSALAPHDAPGGAGRCSSSSGSCGCCLPAARGSSPAQWHRRTAPAAFAMGFVDPMVLMGQSDISTSAAAAAAAAAATVATAAGSCMSAVPRSSLPAQGWQSPPSSSLSVDGAGGCSPMATGYPPAPPLCSPPPPPPLQYSQAATMRLVTTMEPSTTGAMTAPISGPVQLPGAAPMMCWPGLPPVPTMPPLGPLARPAPGPGHVPRPAPAMPRPGAEPAMPSGPRIHGPPPVMWGHAPVPAPVPVPLLPAAPPPMAPLIMLPARKPELSLVRLVPPQGVQVQQAQEPREPPPPQQQEQQQQPQPQQRTSVTQACDASSSFCYAPPPDIAAGRASGGGACASPDPCVPSRGPRMSECDVFSDGAGDVGGNGDDDGVLPSLEALLCLDALSLPLGACDAI